MREFLLLRHGKSDYPPDTSDFDRPLAKRGKKDSLKVGQWLRDHGHVPDRIVTSPARRAANTATRVGKVLELDPANIIEEPRLYLASSAQIMEILHAQPDSAQRVLIAGHNPGLEELVAALSGQPGPFPTSALAVFRLHGGWQDISPETAETVSIIRPRALA